MDVVAFGGWSRCARLVSGDLEAIVTLDVGPRVVRFGAVGGPNEFVEYAGEMGKTGGDEFVAYGGHRFWIAPELFEVTYEPDNAPVETFEEAGRLGFRTPLGACGLQREILLGFEGGAPCLKLEHRITNRSSKSYTVAPWALSVMATGGSVLIPHAEFKPHTEELLPARPLVLWHYTKMSDPRFTWGDRAIRMRQDANLGPTKFGMMVQQGIAAYANHGNVFVKRFPFCADGEYFDYGCNFESFTRQDMLEVESLGAKATLKPGDQVSYPETWYLLKGVTPPEDDAECGKWFETVMRDCPL